MDKVPFYGGCETIIDAALGDDVFALPIQDHYCSCERYNASAISTMPKSRKVLSEDHTILNAGRNDGKNGTLREVNYIWHCVPLCNIGKMTRTFRTPRLSWQVHSILWMFYIYRKDRKLSFSVWGSTRRAHQWLVEILKLTWRLSHLKKMLWFISKSRKSQRRIFENILIFFQIMCFLNKR